MFQRISSRVPANQFVDESVFQQISFADESMSLIFADELYVTNELVFTEELHVTSESVSLPNSASPAKQFHYQFSTADSYVKNDVNVYNNLIV